MNKRDEQIIRHINTHFDELLEEAKQLNSFDEFAKGGVLAKAIKMDILQIGENINALSEEAKAQLNPKDLRGVADVKNHIAHGYISVDDQVIWDVILKRLPELINQINSIK